MVNNGFSIVIFKSSCSVGFWGLADDKYKILKDLEGPRRRDLGFRAWGLGLERVRFGLPCLGCKQVFSIRFLFCKWRIKWKIRWQKQ